MANWKQFTKSTKFCIVWYLTSAAKATCTRTLKLIILVIRYTCCKSYSAMDSPYPHTRTHACTHTHTHMNTCTSQIFKHLFLLISFSVVPRTRFYWQWRDLSPWHIGLPKKTTYAWWTLPARNRISILLLLILQKKNSIEWYGSY